MAFVTSGFESTYLDEEGIDELIRQKMISTTETVPVNTDNYFYSIKQVDDKIDPIETELANLGTTNVYTCSDESTSTVPVGSTYHKLSEITLPSECVNKLCRINVTVQLKGTDVENSRIYVVLFFNYIRLNHTMRIVQFIDTDIVSGLDHVIVPIVSLYTPRDSGTLSVQARSIDEETLEMSTFWQIEPIYGGVNLPLSVV